MAKNLIIGDVHCKFRLLNKLIETEEPEILIQTGDFGVFLKGLDDLNEVEPKNTKIYFIDGNHDNHEVLDAFELGKIHEVRPNIFFCAFGSTLDIDGKTYLFCGGADSIDKGVRTPGFDWWPTERIREVDLAALPNANTKIDVVVSHTAPDYFDLKLQQKFGDYYDPSTRALSYVFDMFKPRMWWFSHFHKGLEGRHKQCLWTLLHCMNYGGIREL